MGYVKCVAFSPDGSRILPASGDVGKPGDAKVWDANKGQELFSLKGHTGGAISAAFSPDGRRILTGSADSPAAVWDAANGQEHFSLKGHTNAVAGVAVSPDGRRLLTR